MAKDIFSIYRETDRTQAPTEIEVAKARRFVFWHKLGWIMVGTVAAVWTATVIPVWLLFTAVGAVVVIGGIAGIIWLMEKNDEKQKVLKAAKQIGVRKDV